MFLLESNLDIYNDSNIKNNYLQVSDQLKSNLSLLPFSQRQNHSLTDKPNLLIVSESIFLNLRVNF